MPPPHLRRRHRRHPRRPVRHLSGHSPSYFAERLPGALASRISATANAAFTLENTGSWNVLPPIVAVVLLIVFIGSVNPALAGALIGFAAALGTLIFYLARRGTPLHRAYAGKAAAVDGELVDVIGNFQCGARVRRDVARATAHRRRRSAIEMARPPAQPDLSGAAAADPCGPDRVR